MIDRQMDNEDNGYLQPCDCNTQFTLNNSWKSRRLINLGHRWACSVFGPLIISSDVI